MKALPIRLAIFFFSLPLSLSAWDNHAMLTSTAVSRMPEVQQAASVKVEALESFITAEQKGLVTLLDEVENWAKQNVATYPPLPAELKFTDGEDEKALKDRFIASLRLNPIYATGEPYFQLLPGVKGHKKHAPFIKMQPFCADNPTCHTHNPFEILEIGETISALDALATAVDEPDYGFDVDLWENNDTQFAKKYHWGKQPFGSSASFGTQAPFHMAFYHEPSLIYTLAPFLQRTYPDYRTHVYLSLARFAFKTGHPYWGWRFLGYGLHYLQDMTQPYHVSVIPGRSTSQMLWTYFLKTTHLGSDQFITNEHFALENYTFYRMVELLSSHDKESPIIKALQDMSLDASFPAYSNAVIRDVISQEAYDKGSMIKDALYSFIPKHYLSDPDYIFYETNPDIDLITETSSQPAEKKAAFDQTLAILLKPFGIYTRNVIRYILKE